MEIHRNREEDWDFFFGTVLAQLFAMRNINSSIIFHKSIEKYFRLKDVKKKKKTLFRRKRGLNLLVEFIYKREDF